MSRLAALFNFPMVRADRSALGAGAENALSLCFDSQDDALNFARDSAERGNDWLARNEVNLAKHYIEGRCNVILEIRSDTDDQVGYFVFRRVPPVHAYLGRSFNSAIELQRSADGGGAYGDDRAMRVGVSHAIKCAKQRVPSRVWFEAREQRPYFGWVSPQATTVKFSEDTGFIICERESGVAGVPTDKGNGVGIHSVVEGIPKVAGCILHDPSYVSGELLCQADFMSLLAGLHVFIDNSDVWFSREERIDARFSVFNVFPATLDL